MTMGSDRLERERVNLQAYLDRGKSQVERNRLGQFSTPTALATDILRYASRLLPHDALVRFLDPAVGTGSFYSALTNVLPAGRIGEAVGFEVDPHYARPAAQLWSGGQLVVKLADFTREAPEPRFNLVICNPPYVRHHHVPSSEKARLQVRTLQASGMKVGGLAGLYCHFIGISQGWLAPDAISGWLVPSEFMDVNYGEALRRYLLERVTLLHIHRFDPADVQFADALVSSAVVWFRNAPSPAGHTVKFTFGGSLASPHLSKTIPAIALAQESKWTRFPAADLRGRSTMPMVGDFFRIKRGLATGDNKYFILSAEEIESRRLPIECFRPILPSPRYIESDEIAADDSGLPVLEQRLFLLNTKLPEQEVRSRYPTLADYLVEGKAKGLHERYLCSHRVPWYAQEERPPAPIVCTYLGRGDNKNGRPFRFILNRSSATVANVYLAMYPTAAVARSLAADTDLIQEIWRELNRIRPDQLVGEGRVYGGGLHKLEPRELATVPVPLVARLLPRVQEARQAALFLDTGV
jgi:hypothetical protein